MENEVEDGRRAERGDDRRTRKTLEVRSIPCDRNDPQARALRGDAMRSLTFLASRLARALHDRGDRWTKLASSLFQRGGLLASRFSHP